MMITDRRRGVTYDSGIANAGVDVSVGSAVGFAFNRHSDIGIRDVPQTKEISTMLKNERRLG